VIGRFLVPEPLPERLLYVEPLRRRVRVRFGGTWTVDSEQVVLLFKPGRYPVACFPETDTTHKEVDDEGNRCDGPGCANGRHEVGGSARAPGSDQRCRRSGSCVGIHLG
jgi:hypothetical protein